MHAGTQPAQTSAAVLLAIVERSASGPLDEAERAALRAAVNTLARVTTELGRSRASTRRLRAMLFGAKTEKTERVLRESGPAQAPGAAPAGGDAAAHGAAGADAQAPATEGVAPAGHGRNGAPDYPGAHRHDVPHPTLKPGDPCPDCGSGHLYALDPSVVMFFTGGVAVDADLYACERLRCSACQKVHGARPPPQAGARKYDETVPATIGLHKYGAGTPFFRLQKLQDAAGVPLPASTQWDLVHEAARDLRPVHAQMERQAAQADLLHNDDTTMKVLELTPELRAQMSQDTGSADAGRTGAFTTGIVALGGGHSIALYRTGAQHAGENLADVLAHRAPGLAPPVQMCDGLDRNAPGDFETVLANCLAHARRRYVDVAASFPEECRFVLERLREVYRNDAVARSRKMSPEERLGFHQAHSGPEMDGLRQWMKEQSEQKKVEPNSGLGQAIAYMTERWSALTLFLRMAGSPLDNNICERALKKAILHRKNALFYKTLNGALVGDIFMSLIQTALLAKVSPFDYLVALLRNTRAVRERPADWMPWNYKDVLGRRPAVPAALSAGPPAVRA